MREQSDEELASMVAVGDGAAFKTLVSRHQHAMQHFAARMLGLAKQDDAEDLVVECFLRFWQHRARFVQSSKPIAWLYRTLYRLTIDELRRQSRATPLFEEPATERRLTDADVVWHALGQLNPELRAVISLVGFQGLSYEEASQILGIPVGTVASRKHQAIQELRSLIKGEEQP